MKPRETDWGCVEWIQLARNRDRWRAVVNAVINLLDLAPRSYLVYTDIYVRYIGARPTWFFFPHPHGTSSAAHLETTLLEHLRDSVLRHTFKSWSFPPILCIRLLSTQIPTSSADDKMKALDGDEKQLSSKSLTDKCR
jgi:hypothetical protein